MSMAQYLCIAIIYFMECITDTDIHVANIQLYSNYNYTKTLNIHNSYHTKTIPIQ